MLVRKLLCAAALSSLIVGSAEADDHTMRAAVAQALKDVPVEDMVSRAGYSSAQQSLVEEYMRDLVSNETIASLVTMIIVDTAPDEFKNDTEAAPVLVRDYAAGAYREIGNVFAAYLPTEERRRFLEMHRQVLSGMEPQDCASHLLDKRFKEISVSQRLEEEIEVLNAQPAEFQQEWLELNGAALRAGAEGHAQLMQMPDEEFQPLYDAGETALKDSFSSLVDTQPRRDELIRAYFESHSAPAEDVCEVYQLELDAALEVEGDLSFYAMFVALTQRA